MQAGSVERTFEVDADPRGRPIRWGGKMSPVLLAHRGGAQIPRAAGERHTTHLGAFSRLDELDDASCSILLKAARLYQQAIWIADADPNVAWLLLVSAAETVAASRSAGTEDHMEQLQLWKPELAELLQTNCSPEVASRVAVMLADYTRSTKKFIGFLTTYAPQPPQERPRHDWERFDFTVGGIKNAASQVYGHRSRFLHAGTVMPAPMCWPPQCVDASGVSQEVPIGLAGGTKRANWSRESTPMLLHTFEYLVRGALLKWCGVVV